MCAKGMQSFDYHRDDPGPDRLTATAAPGIAAGPVFPPANQDPETAARSYINQLHEGGTMPALATLDAATPDDGLDLKFIGSEAQPLTGTTAVKFYQRYQKVPIYGSLITVVLDEPSHQFVAINGALAAPRGVDSAASISPRQAEEIIGRYGGNMSGAATPPRPYYYFDSRPGQSWRLVYIAEDVPLRATAFAPANGAQPATLMNYVVDAHSGELVATLARTHTSAPARGLDPPPYRYRVFDDTTATSRIVELADDPAVAAAPAARSVGTANGHDPGQPRGPQRLEGYALDGLGRRRAIRYFRDEAGHLRLEDQVRNVRTYDFGFRNYQTNSAALPGSWVVDPPDPWDPAAVSAHANAVAVADFFLTVLQRNGLDNLGGSIVSTINCIEVDGGYPAFQEWPNAQWNPGARQMLYGQVHVDGSLRTYAVALDVVAHEITHGLTAQTADLDYHQEPGALNESYSDIFGILVSNQSEPDIARWDWEIGGELGTALRDLSDPGRHNQPAHMNAYRTQSDDYQGDYGGVHANSGIHNKAAYNLLTASGVDGRFLFTPLEGATLFYQALTSHLTRTSDFQDSRVAVETVAKTLFRNNPDRVAKLAAVARAFDAVGITR